jgi:hypothetical protein
LDFSPRENTNQTDHVFVNKRGNSNTADVLSFREDHYDTDHYRVVTNVRQRLSIKKKPSSAGVLFGEILSQGAK